MLLSMTSRGSPAGQFAHGQVDPAEAGSKGGQTTRDRQAQARQQLHTLVMTSFKELYDEAAQIEDPKEQRAARLAITKSLGEYLGRSDRNHVYYEAHVDKGQDVVQSGRQWNAFDQALAADRETSDE